MRFNAAANTVISSDAKGETFSKCVRHLQQGSCAGEGCKGGCVFCSSLHASPVAVMRFNAAANTVISIDAKGTPLWGAAECGKMWNA
jgi:hypothetical protein